MSIISIINFKAIEEDVFYMQSERNRGRCERQMKCKRKSLPMLFSEYLIGKYAFQR